MYVSESSLAAVILSVGPSLYGGELPGAALGERSVVLVGDDSVAVALAAPYS